MLSKRFAPLIVGHVETSILQCASAGVVASGGASGARPPI